MGRYKMEFLDGRQKVVLLRKKYGLKQQDFETENFTRGYLGLIENGKRTMTEKAAEVIVERIRAAAEKEGDTLDIDKDYFLRTAKEDAQRYCDEHINFSVDCKDIMDMLHICETYNLTKSMIRCYITQGLLYIKDKDYLQAYEVFFRAFTHMDYDVDKQDRDKIYYWIGYCSYKKKDFIQAIAFLERHINFIDNNKENMDILKDFYLLAVCNKELLRYDEAITYIKSYISRLNLIKDKSDYIEAMSFMAQCYRAKGDYERSISLIKDTIEFIKYNISKSSKILSLSNRLNEDTKRKLAQLYMDIAIILKEKKEYDMAFDYLVECEDMRSEINDDKIVETTMEKAKLYIIGGMYNEAVETVLYGMEQASQYDSYDYILYGNDILESCYMALGDIKKLINVINKSIEIIKNNGDYKSAIIKYNKLQDIYFNMNESSMAYKCQIEIKNLLYNI